MPSISQGMPASTTALRAMAAANSVGYVPITTGGLP